jgi:hypothetical protein
MGEWVDTDDGVPKFSLLWTSPEFVDEDAPKKKLRLTGKTPSTAEKHTSSSLQKSLTIFDPAEQIPLRRLNQTGLHAAYIFYALFIFLFFFKFSTIETFMNYAGFEENTRKHSLLDLCSFKKTYDLKASIKGVGGFGIELIIVKIIRLTQLGDNNPKSQ